MIIRNKNNELIEVNINDFISDNDYYSFIMYIKFDL